MLEEGRPLHGVRMVAFLAPGRDQAAFVAGRRVGSAVVRNRARRTMRAAWREVSPRMQAGHDVAWVARSTIRGARTQDLVAEMNELLTAAGVVTP